MIRLMSSRRHVAAARSALIVLVVVPIVAVVGCSQEKTKTLDEMTATEVAQAIGCDKPDTTKTLTIAEEQFSCGAGMSPDINGIKYANAADAQKDLEKCQTSMVGDRQCIGQGKWLFDGYSAQIGRVQQAFGIPNPTPSIHETPAGDPSAAPSMYDSAGGTDPNTPELKAGQTATLADLGLTVKATWGEFDKTVSTGDGPHDKGCTWITIAATNTGTKDFLTSTDTTDTTNPNPHMSFDMTAGDTLRSVSSVATEGSDDWPRRIKAGKTETWRECFLAEEQEQHLTLNSSWNNADSSSTNMVQANWTRS